MFLASDLQATLGRVLPESVGGEPPGAGELPVQCNREKMMLFETLLRDQFSIIRSRLNLKVKVVGKFTPHKCF